MNLLNEENVERYEEAFKAGADHLYPNENIVRLVKWFLGGGGWSWIMVLVLVKT